MRDRKSNASGRDTRRRRNSVRGGGGGGIGGGIGGPNTDPVSPLRGIESRSEIAHGEVGNKQSDLGAAASGEPEAAKLYRVNVKFNKTRATSESLREVLSSDRMSSFWDPEAISKQKTKVHSAQRQRRASFGFALSSSSSAATSNAVYEAAFDQGLLVLAASDFNTAMRFQRAAQKILFSISHT